MITYSGDFNQELSARNHLMQITDARPALAADLAPTRCPDARLVRIRSEQAPYALSAGFPQRHYRAGCANCPVCWAEDVAERVMKWSQRLKAVLAYETAVRESHIQFCTLSFPKHRDGTGPDKLPSEELCQSCWENFRSALRDYYQRKLDVRYKDAVNLFGFLEEGGRHGWRHFHMIYCARPGYLHPHTIDTGRRYTYRWYNPRQGGWVERNQKVDGLCEIWETVLRNHGGFEPLNHWFRDQRGTPEQLASYCVARYLTKGYKKESELGINEEKQRPYRIRAMQQSPAWPALLDWYRDRRFNLGGKMHRRWIGFRLHFREFTAENLNAEMKALAASFLRDYQLAVSVPVMEHSDQLVKLRSFDLPSRSELAKRLLRVVSNEMGKHVDKRAVFAQEPGLPIGLELKPVMVCLSDRPVSHPARASFISIASYYESDGAFSTVQSSDNPSSLITKENRFNLCGASHWFPLDDMGTGFVAHITDTPAFQELVEWNKSLRLKLEELVTPVLTGCLPGNAFQFMIQGMQPASDRIFDGERVDKVARGFDGVFDITPLGYPRVQLPVREERPDFVDASLPEPGPAVRAGLERAAGWHEPASTLPVSFGRFQLKQGQSDIIRRVRNRLSGIYNLPTGYGKSLCYQVPWVEDGITLVVSPLVALIRDQIAMCSELGIKATWLTGSLPDDQRDDVLAQVGIFPGRPQRDPAILYAAPEALSLQQRQDGSFRYLPGHLINGTLRVSHLVVDEAHCVTRWAGYRPSYGALPKYVAAWDHYPDVVSCFSATISGRILEDLQLAFGDLDFFALPMHRQNLVLHIVHDTFEGWFPRFASQLKLPAVFYCGERRNAEGRALELRDNYGLIAAHYHAKMPSAERRWTERAFLNGDIDVLCATVAFGMGVDHSHIRTVVHDSSPDTIEDYVQQIGRGGRDGEDTACYFLLPGSHNNELSRFFHTRHCLWQYVARFHGQEAAPCGRCSACQQEE